MCVCEERRLSKRHYTQPSRLANLNELAFSVVTRVVTLHSTLGDVVFVQRAYALRMTCVCVCVCGLSFSQCVGIGILFISAAVGTLVVAIVVATSFSFTTTILVLLF